MVDDKRFVDKHVGELLSGFVDGELTQQQRQLVSLHCDRCEECGENLASLKALRVRIGRANLSELGEDKWRETMDEKGVQTSRSIGWLLFIAGILGIGGVVLISFLFNDEIDTGCEESGRPEIVPPASAARENEDNAQSDAAIDFSPGTERGCHEL